MSLEADLKKEVIAFLNKAGVWYFRMNSGKIKVKRGFIQLHETGTADFLLLPQGRVLWCELKGKGQATAKSRVEAQQAFRDKVIAAGHEHAVCTSVDEVIAALKEKK